MLFKDLVMKQTLSPTEFKYAEDLCKRWEGFSNTVGVMSKKDVLKMLRYLVEYRPHSKTLGKRAVQRFNALNKVRWEDLINGNREGSGEISEGTD